MISTDNRKYAFMKKLNFRKIDSDISTNVGSLKRREAFFLLGLKSHGSIAVKLNGKIYNGSC